MGNAWKLLLGWVVFFSPLAQAIDWTQFHNQIKNTCANGDAACVGHVMLNALEASTGGGITPEYQYADIHCFCNGNYDLQCSVGTGSNERAISGTTSIGVLTNCQQDAQIVKIRGRLCDGNYDLVRVDLQNFKFALEANIGVLTNCLAAAKGQ